MELSAVKRRLEASQLSELIEAQGPGVPFSVKISMTRVVVPGLEGDPTVDVAPCVPGERHARALAAS